MNKTLYETLVTSYQENKLSEQNRKKETEYLNAMIRYREKQSLLQIGGALTEHKTSSQTGMGVHICAPISA